LQDKFAVVVARALWFPQILGCGVGVFSKVGASIGVGACGMNGTDEVSVAGIKQTARAFREFGHGGGVAVYAKFPLLCIYFNFNYSERSCSLVLARSAFSLQLFCLPQFQSTKPGLGVLPGQSQHFSRYSQQLLKLNQLMDNGSNSLHQRGVSAS
jgi:hypothetical protein